jgi:hypothetical protein
MPEALFELARLANLIAAAEKVCEGKSPAITLLRRKAR